MDFDHVKAGTLGAFGRLAIVGNNAWDLVGFQCTWRAGGVLTRGAIFKLYETQGAFAFQGTRCYRLLAVRLNHFVRNSPNVPQLQSNTATFGVYCVNNAFPACFLLIRPNTGCIHVATGSGRYVGGFADDQSRSCALAIVSFLNFTRYAIGCTRTCQWRHNNPVRNR